MARQVVIYKKPKDPEAFDRHYFGVHVPLAKKIPGLRKYEIGSGPVRAAVGGGDYHLVATLHYDDMAAIQRAFASPEGQAAADRRVFAPNDADMLMLLFDDREV